jgi:hypothetical protein
MNSSAEHEIINLAKQKWDWMSAQDDAPLTAQRASRVRPHGRDLLEGARARRHQDRTHPLSRRDIKDVSVRFIGSTAIVLTTLQLGAVVDGNEVSNPFVVTEVYVQQADAWTLASMSFTRLVTH